VSAIQTGITSAWHEKSDAGLIFFITTVGVGNGRQVTYTYGRKCILRNDGEGVSKRTTDFLLVPDKASARKVRRTIAESGARLNVVVGTWTELEAMALGAYLLPGMDDNWLETINDQASSMTGAFWQGSLSVAREKTVASIARMLERLIEARPPSDMVDPPDLSKQLSGRSLRHFSNLFELFLRLKGALPHRLAVIRTLLDTPSSEAIHFISVRHTKGFPPLNPWKRELIKKLNTDCSADSKKAREYVLENYLKKVPLGKKGTALAHIQQHLFSDHKKRIATDGTTQWIGVRDYLEEAEITAGMVQKVLSESPELQASDIALLIPAENLYCQSLLNVFDHAGLALSGLPVERNLRDLGREVISDFLHVLDGPAPVMAIASLLSSPLMPWSLETGMALAGKVMNGDFELEVASDLGQHGSDMLDLIKYASGPERNIAGALRSFDNLLAENGLPEVHLQRARTAIDDVLNVVSGNDGILTPDIYSLVAVEVISDTPETDINREGVSIFLEHEEPWRATEHLFVLGFSEGRYPQSSVISPVFTEQDIIAIRNNGMFELVTEAENADLKRQRLCRQLCTATKSVTFFIPHKDGFGKKLAPSESLTFMARLVEGANDPQELILDVDNEQSRNRIKGLSLTSKPDVIPPRTLTVETLDFDRNLFSLRKDKRGNIPPVSPSRFEKMLVSPLAWLLSDLRAEPIPWAPEEMDAMVQGTLAHAVFENLFLPDADLPPEGDIPERVEALLVEAIKKRMPLLQTAAWHVEKNKLRQDIVEAAFNWLKILQTFDARIMGNETHLRGTFSRLPVHGYVDTVIALPNGRLYVVDFKKSKSAGRHSQMEKGYDSQASLYRKMLETGGPVDFPSEALVSALETADEIGVLYFMMNDGIALADTGNWGEGRILGLRELGNDVSVEALDLLKKRIKALRKGTVLLNHENDGERIEKETGLKPYALGDSPLILLYAYSDESDAGGLI
jgi:ATP-dependent helicase/nuclease subunit B